MILTAEEAFKRYVFYNKPTRVIKYNGKRVIKMYINEHALKEGSKQLILVGNDYACTIPFEETVEVIL